jgi:hypothetical protein
MHRDQQIGPAEKDPRQFSTRNISDCDWGDSLANSHSVFFGNLQRLQSLGHDLLVLDVPIRGQKVFEWRTCHDACGTRDQYTAKGSASRPGSKTCHNMTKLALSIRRSQPCCRDSHQGLVRRLRRIENDAHYLAVSASSKLPCSIPFTPLSTACLIASIVCQAAIVRVYPPYRQASHSHRRALSSDGYPFACRLL